MNRPFAKRCRLYLSRKTLVQRRVSGFTLVELLVTIVAGVVVLGGTVFFSLSQIRSDAIQQRNLQLRLEANRAASWIDSEISRASGFDNIAATGCSAPTGTSLIVSLRALTAAGSVERVSYYSPTGSAVGNVVRCGPPVVCTGGTACGLDTTGSATTYLVASNARFTVTPTPTATPVRALSYTISIVDGGITSEINRQAVAGAPSYD